MCSAELRAQLATKDEQIDALTKQVGMLDVKPGPKIVGVFIKRAVHEGTGKDSEAYFTLNPGGTKKYLKAEDADMWVRKEAAEVLAEVAAHDAKMAALKASSPAK